MNAVVIVIVGYVSTGMMNKPVRTQRSLIPFSIGFIIPVDTLIPTFISTTFISLTETCGKSTVSCIFWHLKQQGSIHSGSREVSADEVGLLHIRRYPYLMSVRNTFALNLQFPVIWAIS